MLKLLSKMKKGKNVRENCTNKILKVNMKTDIGNLMRTAEE